ncbi:MAG: AHH domain-containing protein [Gammaproteobacteria bacterium]|nr:AHH domain-containing protein [Gammaproteobacteria bacterium]
MSTIKTIDGITYEELSLEEFEEDLFHLAGEDYQAMSTLMTELKDAIWQEVMRSANGKKAGKTPTQIMVERQEYQIKHRKLIKIQRKAAKRLENRERNKHLAYLNLSLWAAGRVGPAGTDDHHIVSWNDLRALRARAILRQFGIEVDDECNGAALPSGKKNVPHPDMPNACAHKTVHTNVYYVNVEFLLEGLAVDPDTTKQNVVDLLREIARQLTEGTFPLKNRLDGKAV